MLERKKTETPDLHCAGGEIAGDDGRAGGGGRGMAAFYYGRSVYRGAGTAGRRMRSSTISRGMRAPEIAAALESSGIISDDSVFLAAAYLTQNFRRMKAGEYQFPQPCQHGAR